MDYMSKYTEWIENPDLDPELKNELSGISGNESEIALRFSRDLEFGTAGMRGIIGAGTNRINIHVIKRVTQAVANFINKSCPEYASRGVAIAYDCRRMSPEFAMTAALVLCGNGITVYIYDKLQPTPVLSFTVRHLKAAMGIVITSSHNTAEYNGYKLYGDDGAQMAPDSIESILNEIATLPYFEGISEITRAQAEKSGLLKFLGDEIVIEYVRRVIGLRLRPAQDEISGNDLSILYTPLHGTGSATVHAVLKGSGFTNFQTVASQARPDGNFPTVKSPNPEFPEAFAEAFKIARETHPDVIIVTDPDSDRLGVSVKNNSGEHVILSGNQVGAMLTEYILSTMKAARTLPANGKIIKTIVTSNLSDVIAEYYGVSHIDTLTGFKFIAEQICEMERTGESTFIFGFEESIGYLYGDFVRDKDAVVASLMVCEMILYYKSLGMTLFDLLESIWKRHGYYADRGYSYDITKNPDCMKKVRTIQSGKIAGMEIVEISDFLTGMTTRLTDGRTERLPQPASDVYKCYFADDSWFCVRPSGTEPKVKIYISSNASTYAEAQEKAQNILDRVLEIIK